jgi:hypothetical protein
VGVIGGHIVKAGADAEMLHSTITLTLDNCGHLVKGTESQAVASMPTMIVMPGLVAAMRTVGAQTGVSASESAQGEGL